MNLKKYNQKLKKFFLFFVILGGIYAFLFNSFNIFTNLRQLKITPMILFFPNKLIEEIKQLKEENLKLSLENIQLKKKDFFLLENEKLPHTQADVILYLNTHQGQYFIINKGCQINQVNKIIVVYDKFLLGKVIKCNDYLSKVELLTNQNFKTSVKSAKSEINGLFEIVRNEPRITLTQLNKEIEDNELIITSGLDGVFPAGLIVGQYKKSQDAIQLLVNFNNISKVTLININVE